MAAQIVHLQQLHPLGQQGKILGGLPCILHIVHNADGKTGACHHALDKAGVCNGGGPIDGVFRLDLGDMNTLHLLCIGHKAVGELQAGAVHRIGAAEKALDASVILIKVGHTLDILAETSGQKGTQLALQAAAGDHRQSGQRIAHHLAVYCADGAEGIACADMQTGAHHQAAADDHFSVHKP